MSKNTKVPVGTRRSSDGAIPPEIVSSEVMGGSAEGVGYTDAEEGVTFPLAERDAEACAELSRGETVDLVITPDRIWVTRKGRRLGRVPGSHARGVRRIASHEGYRAFVSQIGHEAVYITVVQ